MTISIQPLATNNDEQFLVANNFEQKAKKN